MRDRQWRRGPAVPAFALLFVPAIICAPRVPFDALNCTPAGFVGDGGAEALSGFAFGRGLLVYIRNGKTGSTTVLGHLRAVLRHSVPMYHYVHSPSMPHGKLAEHKLVSGGFGVCHALWHAEGRVDLPCAHFMVLREPLARIVSSYSYFCVACAEGGRKCRQDAYADSPFLPRACPNLTLAEYTQLEGAMYAEDISGLHACAPCDLPRARSRKAVLKSHRYRQQCGRPERTGVGAQRAPFDEEAKAAMVAHAKSNLRRHVLPLIFEDSLEEGLAVAAWKLGWPELGRVGGTGLLPRRNTGTEAARKAGVAMPGTRAAAISAEELAAAAAVLAPDVALYEYACSVYREYRVEYRAARPQGPVAAAHGARALRNNAEAAERRAGSRARAALAERAGGGSDETDGTRCAREWSCAD